MGIIKTGAIIEADDLINNLLGLSFKNYAQTIFNADYIGWNSNLDSGANGAPDFENLTYDTFKDNTKLDLTNFNTFTDFNGASYLFADVDTFDSSVYNGNLYDAYDSVVDTDKWESVGTETLTLTETADYIQGYHTSHNAADCILSAKALNIRPQSGSIGEVAFYLYIAPSGAGTSDSTKIYIRDETGTEIEIYSLNNDINDSFKLIFYDDAGTQKVHVYKGGYTDITNTDISSLDDTEDWHLRFYGERTGTGGDRTVTIRVYPLIQACYENVTEKTGISETVTASETINNCILIANDDGDTTWTVSADNGSNYESVTLNEVHRFSNTGTQLKVKATSSKTNATSLVRVSEYALLYNVGGGSA